MWRQDVLFAYQKQTEISQKRSKETKNCKGCYFVILSLFSNKTNLIFVSWIGTLKTRAEDYTTYYSQPPPNSSYSKYCCEMISEINENREIMNISKDTLAFYRLRLFNKSQLMKEWRNYYINFFWIRWF